MKKFLVAIAALIFAMSFSGTVFAEEEVYYPGSWKEVIEYFKSTAVNSERKKPSFAEFFYEAMDLLGYHRVSEIEKIDGLFEIIHPEISFKSRGKNDFYRELQARVSAIDEKTQREFIETLKKCYKVSRDEKDSENFQRIFKIAVNAGLLSKDELSEAKKFHSTKNFKDLNKFQVPSFMYPIEDEAESEKVELYKKQSLNEMLEKKAAFDLFKEGFVAEFLNEKKLYDKELISCLKNQGVSSLDFDSIKPPNRMEAFQKLYDEALKTGLIDKRKLHDKMTTYYLMSLAESFEICVNTLSEIMEKRFFDELKRFYSSGDLKSLRLDTAFNVALNSGILSEDELLEIRSEALGAENSAELFLEKIKPIVDEKNLFYRGYNKENRTYSGYHDEA